MKKAEEPEWDNMLLSRQLREWFNDNIKGHILVKEDDLVEHFAEVERGADCWNYDVWSPKKHERSTHKSFLIKSSISPIEKDSFEKLVREFYAVNSSNLLDSVRPFAKRAKRLLEEKKD